MKNILVLLSHSRFLADEWVANHGNSLRDKHTHRWLVAGNIAELEYILSTYFYNGIQSKHIDVEGYILPDFHSNPERARMLELLINHKRAVSNASAETFVTNVLVPNKEKLLQQQTPKMWVGTREEYIKIPVKDPNTVYSITA